MTTSTTLPLSRNPGPFLRAAFIRTPSPRGSFHGAHLPVRICTSLQLQRFLRLEDLLISIE